MPHVNRNSKFSFKSFLTIVFTCLVLIIYSRGGGGGFSGGGGHGGGHGGGGYRGYSSRGYHTDSSYNRPLSKQEKTALWYGFGILAAIFLPLIGYFIYKQKKYEYREAKIEKLMAQSAKNDVFWDVKLLKQTVYDAFVKIQDAWEARDIEIAREFITNRLYLKYKEVLEEMTLAGNRNVIPFYAVRELHFVEIEDFKDDNHDKFTAVLYGSINDYLLNEQTNAILENPNKQMYPFSDSYHFVRVEDKWLLSEIGVDKDVFDFTEGANIVE